MKAPIPLLALCAALVLAGCGGSSANETTTTGKSGPQVEVPTGPPPRKLVVTDIEKGTGPAVKIGDELKVRWAGFLYRSGKKYYSSWEERNTFTFLTDAGRVIPGWDRGMIGMRVGGRRKLIIPPPLAYGHSGTPAVPPNETLIYVVDLLAIR